MYKYTEDNTVIVNFLPSKLQVLICKITKGLQCCNQQIVYNQQNCTQYNVGNKKQAINI